MNIVIDAMGPEQGPGVIIDGINNVADQLKKCKIYLIGNKALLDKYLFENKTTIMAEHEIIHTENNISMDDTPSKVLNTKMDSSIAIGIKTSMGLENSAFLSMGNTGAVMAFSLKIMGRMNGVIRPAIGTVFPVGRHPLLLDMGATPDCKGEMLHQFALIGSEYSKAVWDIKNPVVALMSIGTEDSKGSIVTQKAFELLSQDKSINFYGNIEGSDLFNNIADVIVFDGFTGNIVIKFAEGMVSFLKEGIKDVSSSSLASKIGMGLAKNNLKQFFKHLSYDEYGGAPLLGVNGISIVGHGKSNARAVSSAVLNAAVLIEHDFLRHVKSRMEERSVYAK